MKKILFPLLLGLLIQQEVSAQKLEKIQEVKYYMLDENRYIEKYGVGSTGLLFIYTSAGGFPSPKYASYYFDTSGSAISIPYKIGGTSGVLKSDGENLVVLDVQKGILSAEVYNIQNQKLERKVQATTTFYDLLKKAGMDIQKKYYYEVRSFDIKDKSNIQMKVRGINSGDGFYYYFETNFTWDLNNPQSLSPIIPEKFPEITFADAYENSIMNGQGEAWYNEGFHNNHTCYSRLFSRKSKTGIDSCIHAVTLFDLNGKQTNSFILNANTEGKKHIILKFGSVAGTYTTASTLLLDRKNGTFYTFTLASDYTNKSDQPILIIKKFDIDGKFLWENLYTLPEKQADNFAAHASFSFYFSTDDNPNIDIRYGFKHFEYEFDQNSGKIVSSTTTGNPNKNYQKMISEITKEQNVNKGLKFDETKDLFKVGPNDYFIAMQGKSRTYYIYRFK